MLRRKSLKVGWALVLLGCGASFDAASQPTHRISAGQIQQVLARRFPLRYAVAGVADLQIEQPQLRLLLQQNRIAGELAVEASGPAFAHAYSGLVALDFALRYEPKDLSIRAHSIRVHSVRLPGLARDAAALVDAYVRASAQRALLEVVVHQLQASDLALADTMGFEPGSITVEADGLAIGFVLRPAR